MHANFSGGLVSDVIIIVGLIALGSQLSSFMERCFVKKDGKAALGEITSPGSRNTFFAEGGGTPLDYTSLDGG